MPDRRPSPPQRPDHFTWRHRVLVALVAVMFLAVGVRLWQIQVRDHERYVAEASLLRYGAVAVVAPRGAILDANGFALAVSRDTWDIYLDSFLWRDREAAREAATLLAGALSLDATAVFALGTAADSGDALLLRDFDYEDGVALRALALWGVRLLPSSVRIYPEADLAAPLIGSVGRDGGGLWGVEAEYDHILRGRDGVIVDEQDPLGRPIAFAPRLERSPVRGGEVQLTIDRFIQAIVERRLEEALVEYQSPGGSIVVMVPHTGAVLAIASRPAVTRSAPPADGEALASLVRARPITDIYEPGSVLKTLTTAAAIDLGLVTPATTYVDAGWVEVGGYVIRNWDGTAYGEVTISEYLQRSLNTGAVWLAHEIGAAGFYSYLAAFGIGEPTYVGLSGEAEGLLRTPADDDWYPVDLATHSYGQGLAVTPMQVLSALNVFANGGMLMRPYIVSRIVLADEVRTIEPVAVRRVVSPETARIMAEMMRDVVDFVPWHGAAVEGFEVAGKTGTTLVSIPTGYDLDTTIASFVGFLPYDAPVVSVLVKIDQPGVERNLGGEVAAPVFALVAADIMQYLSVPRQQVAGQ